MLLFIHQSNEQPKLTVQDLLKELKMNIRIKLDLKAGHGFSRSCAAYWFPNFDSNRCWSYIRPMWEISDGTFTHIYSQRADGEAVLLNVYLGWTCHLFLSYLVDINHWPSEQLTESVCLWLGAGRSAAAKHGWVTVDTCACGCMHVIFYWAWWCFLYLPVWSTQTERARWCTDLQSDGGK